MSKQATANPTPKARVLAAFPGANARQIPNGWEVLDSKHPDANVIGWGVTAAVAWNAAANRVVPTAQATIPGLVAVAPGFTVSGMTQPEIDTITARIAEADEINPEDLEAASDMYEAVVNANAAPAPKLADLKARRAERAMAKLTLDNPDGANHSTGKRTTADEANAARFGTPPAKARPVFDNWRTAGRMGKRGRHV